MVAIMESSLMDVECNRSYVDELFSSEEEKCAHAVMQLKYSLIGSNKQKHAIVEQGLVPRLISLLAEEQSSPQLKINVAYTLGSIAKGADYQLKALIDSGIVAILLRRLSDPEPRVVEACLCCLKTVFQHPEAPIDVLYADANVVPHLVGLMSLSVSCRISVATVLTNACKTREHQDALTRHGLVDSLNALLCSSCTGVHLPALQCLAFLVVGNDAVAGAVASKGGAGGKTMMGQIVALMDRNKPIDTQLAAARCVTYLYRCGILEDKDDVILYKALPCVVRMTKKEESVEQRILAAETLAYLIEVSAHLQRVAAISNHLITSMASFLTWAHRQDNNNAVSGAAAAVAVAAAAAAAAGGGNNNNNNGNIIMAVAAAAAEQHQQQQRPTDLPLLPQQHQALCSPLGSSGDASTSSGTGPGGVMAPGGGPSANLCKDMRRAAFRVFASLGANDEEIRKRIIETDNLMPALVSALEDESAPKLQMAAVGCLHSLSRSVQLLRTTFQDHPVWKPLMKMLSAHGSPVEPLIVASSTLCNLLLEFSPSKEPILDSGAIDMLCHLTHKYEPSLRLNGVWGLMNMAFQAEQRIKVQIIKSLGADQIFRLLSDQDTNVVMKTLGLLRNLLSNKLHIDHIMASHGKQIMQAVVLILESDNRPDVKEQALCILANIADGDSAKQFIMSNEDVLKKVTNYMLHHSSKLQIAAVVCVQNLTWAEDEGSMERQGKLKDFGVYKILQQLLTTTDTALFDKVKGALQQFT